MEYRAIILTPVPRVSLGVVADAESSVLHRIDVLVGEHRGWLDAEPFTAEIVSQIEAYWKSPNYAFSLDCLEQGTTYQRRVWRGISDIPSASVKTYGELAAQLESSPRAVGNACRVNPLPIVVPCHRVVAKGGDGGYAGQVQGELLAFKRWLLAHEGRNRVGI